MSLSSLTKNLAGGGQSSGGAAAPVPPMPRRPPDYYVAERPRRRPGEYDVDYQPERSGVDLELLELLRRREELMMQLREAVQRGDHAAVQRIMNELARLDKEIIERQAGPATIAPMEAPHEPVELYGHGTRTDWYENPVKAAETRAMVFGWMPGIGTLAQYTVIREKQAAGLKPTPLDYAFLGISVAGDVAYGVYVAKAAEAARQAPKLAEYMEVPILRRVKYEALEEGVRLRVREFGRLKPVRSYEAAPFEVIEESLMARDIQRRVIAFEEVTRRGYRRGFIREGSAALRESITPRLGYRFYTRSYEVTMYSPELAKSLRVARRMQLARRLRRATVAPRPALGFLDEELKGIGGVREFRIVGLLPGPTVEPAVASILKGLTVFRPQTGTRPSFKLGTTPVQEQGAGIGIRTGQGQETGQGTHQGQGRGTKQTPRTTVSTASWPSHYSPPRSLPPLWLPEPEEMPPSEEEAETRPLRYFELIHPVSGLREIFGVQLPWLAGKQKRRRGKRKNKRR